VDGAQSDVGLVAHGEVLHFAKFLALRNAPSAAQQAVKQDAATFHARHQADLSGYRFDHDEANTR